jgi:morphogenetic protein associated with SpoVID
VKIHIVQKGDTLWKIAQKYGVDFEELKKMNAQLSNPDMIMPGMKIKVPTGGVPVKKEVQKKEANINIAPKKEAPKKEAPKLEHPYAEQKPFISFDIEEDITAKENIVPEQKKEVPKEAPKAPVKEAPKAPVAEPKPKEEVKPPMPKVPIVEMKPKEEVKPPMPKAPIAEPKLKEPLKQKMPEDTKENIKTIQKAVNVSPLTHVVPPFAPQVNMNNHTMYNPMPNIPNIPMKPANILPEIMKQDFDMESLADDKVEGKESVADQPPEMPEIPYMPQMPHHPFAQQPAPFMPNMYAQQPTPIMPNMYIQQPAPFMPNMYAQQPAPMQENDFDDEVAPISVNMQPDQYCVPTTPVMPGYGFSYPPMAMAPTSYQPMYPNQPDQYFPGVDEHMNESSDYMPEMPNVPPNVAAANVNQPAPSYVSPISNVPPLPQEYPVQIKPYAHCVPITPVMPGYGFNVPIPYQPYTPTAPYGYGQPMQQTYGMPMQTPSGFPGQQVAGAQYGPPNMPLYPPAQAPSSYYPMAQPYGYSPAGQPTAVSPFFMMPEYGESSEYEQ